MSARSSQVSLDQDIAGQVRSGQGQVKSIQIRTCRVRSDQDCSNQVRAD